MAAGAAALLLGAATAAEASTDLYCGAGRGPTAEVAIYSATEDAINSASWQGPVECEVYEVEVWEILDDPNHGHLFRAQVFVTCEAA